MKRVLNSSLDLIGNTPKIKLQKIVPENAADVWLKYEAVNPTGSYKNRMGNEITKQLGDKIDIFISDKMKEFKFEAQIGLNTKTRNFSPHLCDKIQTLLVEEEYCLESCLPIFLQSSLQEHIYFRL